jgi:hypothetical protein
MQAKEEPQVGAVARMVALAAAQAGALVVREVVEEGGGDEIQSSGFEINSRTDL